MATGRIGTTPVLRTRWSKEPAGGTTSLSGLDDNSVSLVYEVGYEAVYQNGALLSRGNDYTATDGTTITLTNATVAGDIIEVFANNVVPLTDTYSQSVADGKFVNNTIVDAKGDLIVGSAADTFTRLAVGSANQVLTVDSATTSGLKWATPASIPSTAWTSYTPTWSQAGGSFSLGNGTSTGSYARVGDLVYVTAKLVWGSTTSLSAAYLTGSLPSGLNTRQSAGGIPWLGTMWYYDVSTTAQAIGTAVQHSSTAFRCYYYKADSTNLSLANGFDGSNPWTPATGDEIILWGVYTTDAA